MDKTKYTTSGNSLSVSGKSLSVNDPAITFQTTQEGATFDPSITKTGDVAVWSLGNGEVINSNSLSYTGYAAGTKNVEVYLDDPALVTVFNALADNLAGNLDISQLTSLTHLYCDNNSISVLDVSELISLVEVYCYINSISVLDVSELISLVALYCNNNSISVLDVSALTLLTHLNCGINSISVLDVSALTSLIDLRCYSNSISVLDVSALTSLTHLYCYYNSISVLDVSALTSLIDFRCYNNGMSQVNVSDIVDDLYVNRVALGNNSCNIQIGGTNAAPDADAIAKIEGTGAYTGIGLKDFGSTVTYTAP